MQGWVRRVFWLRIRSWVVGVSFRILGGSDGRYKVVVLCVLKVSTIQVLVVLASTLSTTNFVCCLIVVLVSRDW
jgi:hypothetical protein